MYTSFIRGTYVNSRNFNDGTPVKVVSKLKILTPSWSKCEQQTANPSVAMMNLHLLGFNAAWWATTVLSIPWIDFTWENVYRMMASVGSVE